MKVGIGIAASCEKRARRRISNGYENKDENIEQDEVVSQLSREVLCRRSIHFLGVGRRSITPLFFND